MLFGLGVWRMGASAGLGAVASQQELHVVPVIMSDLRL